MTRKVKARSPWNWTLAAAPTKRTSPGWGNASVIRIPPHITHLRPWLPTGSRYTKCVMVSIRKVTVHNRHCLRQHDRSAPERSGRDMSNPYVVAGGGDAWSVEAAV